MAAVVLPRRRLFPPCGLQLISKPLLRPAHQLCRIQELHWLQQPPAAQLLCQLFQAQTVRPKLPHVASTRLVPEACAAANGVIVELPMLTVGRAAKMAIATTFHQQMHHPGSLCNQRLMCQQSPPHPAKRAHWEPLDCMQ